MPIQNTLTTMYTIDPKDYTLIVAVIKDDTGQWTERFTPFGHLTKNECQKKLAGLVASFNASLRPNELPRTLVSFTFEHKSREF